MLISLMGSHGTGKTSVFDIIRNKNPQWQYFTEGVRHQVPSFAYEDPYKIIEEVGVGGFQLMNINSWSVIDPGVNSILDPRKNIVTDRSSIDNYAYYLDLKNTKQDFDSEKLIKGMAKHYASFVDLFVYFPIGLFPLEGDNMRPDDIDYQKRINEQIQVAFNELEVPSSKIHKLESIDLDERVTEVLNIILNF